MIVYEAATELKEIQSSYRSLLIKFRNNINEENLKFILDEINIFWYTRRLTVKTLLKYSIDPYNSIVFTGATKIDFSIGEHLPYTILGNIHIWDDPVFSYINIIDKISDEKLINELKLKIIETIESNLIILNRYNDFIIILPVRFITENLELVHNISKKLFINLFKKSFNFEDFLVHYKTIDQIEAGLKEELINNIKYILDKDKEIDFKTRFSKFKTRNELGLGTQLDDNELFFNLIYGYICQAVGVFDMCLTYKLIPFLVNDITHRFILLIYPIFLSKDKNTKLIVLRCSLFMIISEIMMIYDLEKLDLAKFINKSKELKVETQIFDAIRDINIDDKEIGSKDIIEKVSKSINYFMREILKQV